MDSINKTFREYLVNYTYLTRLLENYGFTLLKQDEVKELGLPASTGLFKELYGAMIEKGNKNKYGKARDMSPGQKRISFLNRYFVYKKIRSVDADKVSLSMLGQTIDDEKTLEKENTEAEKILEETIIDSKQSKKTKKLQRKIKLKVK